MNRPTPITVLFPEDSETWSSFLRRIRETDGELLVVLTPHFDGQSQILHELRPFSDRVRLAIHDPTLAASARLRGFRVIEHPEELQTLLADDAQLSEALRAFSPQLWRLRLTSRLQRMGLLSTPKLRIYSLVTISCLLCFFVIFRLLPSAEIRVWPRQEVVSQTMNIFLVQSGATLDTTHVRTMPLLPVPVTMTKSVTEDQITKEFLGTPAEVPMTIMNASNEQYSFRTGTRLVNQAGMVFRILESVLIPPGGEATVLARSDELDLFGKIIGERGNVPAGVKWEVYGLQPDERKLVSAENRAAATGGKTSFRTVLTEEDLENGRLRLEKDLLVAAKKAIDEAQQVWNAEHQGQRMEILRPQHSELSVVQYSDFLIPRELLGETVNSVPLEGTITYTMFAYDAKAILDLLSDELRSHVRDGKELLEDSLTLDHLDVRVIGFADDYSWIKLTADLVGTDRFILDPLSPTGALFAKKVRESVAGTPLADAQRILKNMPEAENVEIAIWPPWTRSLPEIPAHISIKPQ